MLKLFKDVLTFVEVSLKKELQIRLITYYQFQLAVCQTKF